MTSSNTTCPFELARNEAFGQRITPLKRVRVTFLFTDIQGSTPLWEERPAEMYRAQVAHDRILVAAVQSRGGRVFNIVGDSVLAVFDDAGDALRAAVAAKRALRVRDARSDPDSIALAPIVRFGLHSGRVIALEDDFRGLEVCRAARVTCQARGGQIVISAQAVGELRRGIPGACELRDLGFCRLRGIEGRQRIFEIRVADLQAAASSGYLIASPDQTWARMLKRSLTPLAMSVALLSSAAGTVGHETLPPDSGQVSQGCHRVERLSILPPSRDGPCAAC